MRFIVVSGLSGAGKSVAMDALEDLGFYCIDNLPVGLLPALAAEVKSGKEQRYGRAAVAVDARNPADALRTLPRVISDLRQGNLVRELIFLEADDEILIKRFSETRRKHPLTASNVSLPEAIGHEREILGPLRELADLCIDTSRTHLHQLRDLIRRRVDQRPLETLSLMFQSFGYKHGVPLDADMVFDVRCLPNPYWVSRLRSLTGRDQEVVEFLESQPLVKEMLTGLTNFLRNWIPRFEADNRAYMTVAVGCTGGRHRSVYLAERLADHFKTNGVTVMVRHRELA